MSRLKKRQKPEPLRPLSASDILVARYYVCVLIEQTQRLENLAHVALAALKTAQREGK